MERNVQLRIMPTNIKLIESEKTSSGRPLVGAILRPAFKIYCRIGFKHNNLSFLILATIFLLVASSCHTSSIVRRAETPIGSSSSTAPRPSVQTDYEAMKTEVKGRQYSNQLVYNIIQEASDWIGSPYLYAGQDRDGTDCSGMIMIIYKEIGDISLPRNSAKQQEYCHLIERQELMPGDLVFFATGKDPQRVSHVGLYIGDNDFIHASSSRGVIVSNLSQNYYNTRFHSAGRIEKLNPLPLSDSIGEVDEVGEVNVVREKGDKIENSDRNTISNSSGLIPNSSDSEFEIFSEFFD